MVTKHIVYPSKNATTIESSKIFPIVGSIGPGLSAVVDSSVYADFFATRYFVAVQSTIGKTNMFDYSICDDGAGGLKQVVFGQIIGGLSFVADSAINSGQVEFTITNNETDTINYKIHKLSF